MNQLSGRSIAALISLMTVGCGGGDVAGEARDRQPAEAEEASRREALARPPAPVDVVIPQTNPRRGRILFITNGCVICHQVNGVGGTAAPPLDRPASQAKVDPLAFSARMWRGAAAMTALQSIELGYVIALEGQDIADIAAFAASSEERTLLTLQSVPSAMQDWFLDTPYWRSKDWSEYKSRGERIPLEPEAE